MPTSTACPACRQYQDLPCAACRQSTPGSLAVKDVWLAVRPPDDCGHAGSVPVQWAVGTVPGGLIAVWDSDLSQFVPSGDKTPFPDGQRYAWFEVTTRCPHRCRHCYLGDRLGTQNVPVSTILEALDQVRVFAVTEVVLAGGEPTMHPDFLPILARARVTAPVVRVLTNGWTQRPAIVQALAQSGVRVEVPLLGWEADHDWMTRTPGSFRRVVKTLHCYRQAGVDLTLTTTLTRVGVAALPALRQLAATLMIPFKPSALVREGAAVAHWAELAPRAASS